VLRLSPKRDLTWYCSDYYEKSDAERRLVLKLDCALLTCLCFGFLMKYIDQTNVSAECLGSSYRIDRNHTSTLIRILYGRVPAVLTKV
jgi:hypothetical protein